jgi:serine/threonine protein kinase
MFQGVWTAGLTWSFRADSSHRRHKTDYEVLEELGSGGFGRVYRVRHRLDQKEYAMKVVRASSSSKEMEKILREVQVLSSIQSNHVCRYYSAWIEQGNLNQGDGATMENGGSEFEEGSSSWPTINQSQATTQSMTISGVKDPICNLCQSTYKDWEVTLEQWGLIDTVLQPLNLCVECYKKSIPPDIDISNISIRRSIVLPECLYILMEYCEATLLDAVRSCRQSESQNKDKAIWSLYGQVVEGIAHLHANSIIHRDVKPSNIFVHGNVVKIGDLGLAKVHHSDPLKVSGSPSKTDKCEDDSAPGLKSSSDVGTYLYAAPEVRNGKHYDDKADVYSLGVVLVEIFHSFSTGMERAKVLGNLREGIFPPDFCLDNPVAFDLAQRMLVMDPPGARPSCFEILQELQSKGLCEENSTNHLVLDLQSQIWSLQEIVQLQNREIVRLRALIAANNIDAEDD